MRRYIEPTGRHLTVSPIEWSAYARLTRTLRDPIGAFRHAVSIRVSHTRHTQYVASNEAARYRPGRRPQRRTGGYRFLSPHQAAVLDAATRHLISGAEGRA